MRQKGKGKEHAPRFGAWISLGIQTARARTHDTKRFPGWTHPPTSDTYIYIYIYWEIRRSYVNVLALYAYTYVHVATRIDLHNNWHDVVFMRWHYQFRTCQICIAVFDDPNHIVVSTLVRTTLCEFHMNVSNMCVWFHVCFVYDLKKYVCMVIFQIYASKY